MRKAIILTLSLIIVLVGISVINKKLHFSSKINKLTGEVAGIFLASKFLDNLIPDTVSAQISSPYQDVQGNVFISGNTGVGTTVSSAKLQIGGLGSANATALRIENVNYYKRDILFSEGGTWGGIIRFDDAANVLQLLTLANSVEIPGISVAESTGYVGLGTNNPQVSLHIKNGGPLLGFTDTDQPVSATNPGWIVRGHDAGYFRIQSSPNADFSAPVDRILINSSGNVGIGTGNPGYTLTVNGTAWVTSGSWSGSDARWKQNIQPISDALDKIQQINGVSFNWNNTGYPNLNFDNQRHLGLVAQDVEKVLPELVTTGPDGYKGIDYNGFIGLMVNAIKQQQVQIKNLQAENASLKSQLEALQSRLKALEAKVQ